MVASTSSPALPADALEDRRAVHEDGPPERRGAAVHRHPPAARVFSRHAQEGTLAPDQQRKARHNEADRANRAAAAAGEGRVRGFRQWRAAALREVRGEHPLVVDRAAAAPTCAVWAAVRRLAVLVGHEPGERLPGPGLVPGRSLLARVVLVKARRCVAELVLVAVLIRREVERLVVLEEFPWHVELAATALAYRRAHTKQHARASVNLQHHHQLKN